MNYDKNNTKLIEELGSLKDEILNLTKVLSQFCASILKENNNLVSKVDTLTTELQMVQFY